MEWMQSAHRTEPTRTRVGNICRCTRHRFLRFARQQCPWSPSLETIGWFQAGRYHCH